MPARPEPPSAAALVRAQRVLESFDPSPDGAWVVVGRFLVPHERLEVAQALRAALARLRERRFAHQWDQA